MPEPRSIGRDSKRQARNVDAMPMVSGAWAEAQSEAKYRGRSSMKSELP